MGMATKKNITIDNAKPFNDDDDRGQTGRGGSAGEIEFRYKDIYSSEPRDDLLSQDDAKRLLSQHAHLHKDYVTKQRNLRKERKARKEGPESLTKLSRGMGDYQMGGHQVSNYKTHPITQKAQFSGATDQKVVNVASLNDANTNEENKKQLENQYQNQLRMTNAPKFNPKPRPY